MSLSKLNSFHNWVSSHNLALIFITLYFLLSIIKLEHPGVNNDQLMFVNAATLHPDNEFLWKSFQGIPLMVFPYIGALKSYLYMPIFYLFGVNIISIRLPQIILISVALFIFYKTLSNLFDKKTSLLCLLLISLDPSLIAYSRPDNGPTVLEFFLKILSVYFLSLYLKSKNLFYFFSIYLCLALGVFNKINFIWFANAFILSATIIYGKTFYDNHKHLGKAVPLLAAFIPSYLLLRLFFKLSRETALSYKQFTSEISLFNIIQNFPVFVNNLSDLTNGNLFLRAIYGYDPTPYGILFSIVVLLFILIGTWLMIWHNKTFLFFILIVVLISLQILLTKRAVSAWHTLVLSPFVTILLGISLMKVSQTLQNYSHRMVLVILVAAIIFYQLIVNYIYINSYSKPTKMIAWSSSIYPLIDYTKLTDAKFVCLDVDICNQLLSFNQETNKYFEVFSFLDPHTYGTTLVELSKNFKSPDKILYISHGDEISHFPSAKLEFLKFVRESKINYTLVTQFRDGDRVIFEVFVLDK